ncbi:M48 family metallopeptidase [Polaribacter sp.]|nr:M48 family metallopeptidase [Polaribacter sp.]
MNANTLFYVFISIIVTSFIIDIILGALNARHYNDTPPLEVADVYDKKEYLKSQAYKKTNANFSNITSLFSITLTLFFFFIDGFKFVDDFARSYTENPILVALIFFGIILIGSDLLTTPFSYYKTFVIEENFGFNKSTRALFWKDKIKGLIMSSFLGGGILALIILFYQIFGENFWLFTWILISLFTVFMNLFYAKLIVPLFNKQTPLEDGELKSVIEKYSKKVGFRLDAIFVIDGSKRSTKANAYFSGFGSQKRITLFDTLIKDLNTEEIVAVLAHEVGHYKRKHILFNILSSLLLTGFMLFLLSFFINMPLFSEALGITIPSFHIGFIAFGVLYSPISEITGIFMNSISRVFEYQADNYAKETFAEKPLISALKKLSKNSLSNLTPHTAYVFMHYSHPTLLERIQNLKKE